MSRRGGFLLWGGLATGLILTVLFAYAASSRNAPAMPRPPELGGQQVPAKIYEIRFDRKYDLFCSFDREDSPIYRN